MATSKGNQNTHLRTVGVLQACHNFLISQTGFQHPGFWITMVEFRIPQPKITWGTYHLHGKTGNSSWKIKWFAPFRFGSFRKFGL